MSTLYQSPQGETTLIDIPGSIADAQGPTSPDNRLHLLSRSPLQAPFAVHNEPRLGKHVHLNIVEDGYYRDIRHLVVSCLEDIKSSFEGDWCGPRRVTGLGDARRPSKRKRKLGEEVEALQPHLWIDSDLGLVAISLSKQPLIFRGSICLNAISDIHNKPVHNEHAQILRLSITGSKSEACQTFLIPGQCTFILSRIQDSIGTFKDAAAKYLSEPTPSAGPGQFDFILLDPPWPNASAKRARSYQRSKSVDDTVSLLRSMQLEDHIAPGGFVGIWITNKRSIRDVLVPPAESSLDANSLLADDGESTPTRNDRLFRRWGVEVVEEWIWIKTTMHGEPATDIDSAWRKPYEILLLARRTKERQAGSPQARPPLRRRVIAGVPDLHSRKPSLRSLVEPLVPDPTRYRALELFARNLTTGWWAWGDEVLKFAWEGAWSAEETGDM